jgi:hypothetical protein
LVIDPNTAIGKIRLRIGDWSDIPVLPDTVIQSTLDDSDNNVPRAAKLCAQYVLATLTSKTHRKMSLQLEVWGAEAYRIYKDFILLTIKDPSFMDISPIPYSASGTEVNPLIDFQQSWNKNYYSGTQSQQLANDADNSPNDGSRTGLLGSTIGWQLT